MNIEKNFIGSRYNIKYHSRSHRFTTYLAGATHENRQEIYSNLSAFLQNLKDEKLAKFSINDNVWQDIKTKALKFKLVIDQHNMVRVIANPTEEYKTIFQKYFPNSEQIDLGVLPPDKNFNKSITDYYERLSIKNRQTIINLHSIHWNCWNDSISLLGISINEIPNGNRKYTPIELINVDIKPKEVSVKPISVNNTKYNYLNFETKDDVVAYIYSQFASIFTIKHLFN